MISAKRYITIVNVALLTAAIYFGVHAVYGYLETRLDHLPLPPASTASLEHAQNNAAAAIQPYAAYETIKTRDLFRTTAPVKENTVEPAIDPNKLDPTHLQLTLWGTVTGSEESSYAVIEDKKANKQDLYNVGDTIQNAVVKMVLREKVVLNVEGVDQILEMDPDRNAAKMGPAPAPSGLFGNTSPDAPVQRRNIKRAMIEEALQDVSNLMRQVQVRPHFVDGKPDGLILSGIRPNSIFRYMGFRNGDVITGVNGRKIETVDDALQFYDNLRTATSSQVQYKRRGSDQTLDIAIE